MAYIGTVFCSLLGIHSDGNKALECIFNGPSHLAPNLKMPEHQVPNPKSLDTQGMRERVCTMPAFDVGFMSSPPAGRMEEEKRRGGVGGGGGGVSDDQ